MGRTHGSHRPYDPDEDAFILDTLADTPRLVGEILGRGPGSVMSRRMILTDQAAYGAFRAQQCARNEETAEHAEAHRSGWSGEDDEFVLGTLDDCLTEVAEALGRTMYSVANRRHDLRHNLVGVHRERIARITRKDLPPVAPLCSDCWTYHNGECY